MKNGLIKLVKNATINLVEKGRGFYYSFKNAKIPTETQIEEELDIMIDYVPALRKKYSETKQGVNVWGNPLGWS